MELEVVLPNESPLMPPGQLVDLAQQAEELGFRTAWLPDHLLPPGEFGATFGGVYEPLMTLGHLGALTDRIRLGTSVLVVPLRDPFLLAKQLATLQQLSAGRIVLGAGVGWSQQEFAAVGADFGRRGAITDDALALLRHLFGGGSAPYEARRFGYTEGVFAPLPEQPVEIMIGGNSDAALRRAARFGDSWQGIPAAPAAFAERAGRLADLAGDRTVAAGLRIGWQGGASGTTAEQLAGEVLEYAAVGADRVAVHFGDADDTAVRMSALVTALRARR
ncbi:TIGR03619 family F420-dependent LLM class oxidoreductase [Microlunatus soli]|nr:TIGR03619 family F420-dependent LLM class oxidoreductase [Microlunatus soli]